MLEWKEASLQMASLMQAKLLICFQLQGDLVPWPPGQKLTVELFSCSFI